MDWDFHELQRLVDEDEIDQLLTRVTLQEIASTWIRHHHTGSGMVDTDDDPDWWAIETWFCTRWWEDEERVRAGLMALIDAAVTEDDLGSVGAGPLEDFICDDSSRIEWIERQASTSPKFRKALSGVWIWDHVTPENFARLERAAGVSLAVPDARD